MPRKHQVNSSGIFRNFTIFGWRACFVHFLYSSILPITVRFISEHTNLHFMLDLGLRAPDFRDLRATDGHSYSLSSFDSKPILVVIFSCNHCPYVKAYEDRMVKIQGDYLPKGVQLIAINSNDDKSYPEDSFQEMVKRSKEKNFNFVYLRDPDQTVVDAYGAVCTPHVFAFDKERKLRYRGRIDDSKDPSMVNSPDLRNAIDDMLAGREVRHPDTRPFGCSIKWMVMPRS